MSGLFRDLNETETAEFAAYARTHMPPSPSWRTLCHPICVAVWLERIANGEDIEFAGPPKETRE